MPALRAVERLAGLQAQLPRPPFVALFGRLRGFRREELAGLVASRAVLRATFYRHTIHLVSARDYLSWRSTLQGALERRAGGAMRRVRMDRAALVAEARALYLERPRTFGEVRALLARRHPGEDPVALAYTVRTMLPLVLVPGGEGEWAYPANADFALAEAFLGEAPAPDREAGREALALRYLAAFGPATAADLRTWSGVAGQRDVLERLRPRLSAFRDEAGRELLDLPRAPRPDPDAPAPVRFLPDFDNLVLGHADRTRIVPAPFKRAFASMNGMVPGAVLVDGFVAGTWRWSATGESLRIDVRALRPIARAERPEVEEEGDALGRFLSPEAQRVEVRIRAG